MKEANKITHIIITILFIAIITLPQIAYWIINEEEAEISISENRNLSPKPTLELSTITEYPNAFENYYNDHLPFREQIKWLWSNINFYLFHTLVSDEVILGKEDWLFYRGDRSIELITGKEEYLDYEKEAIIKNTQENARKLKEKNIDMYVLVLPNKENLYREYLPDTIPSAKHLSQAEEMIEYIKENTDVNLIYPKEELTKMKEKYQIYRKIDTHWNQIGACIGTIALQKEIDTEFNYNIEEIYVETEENEEECDLARFIGMEKNWSEKKLEVTNFYPDITTSVITNDKYEEYISNAENKKTVLLIGDSFRNNTRDYLPKLYEKVIYMHRDQYSEEIIEEINPDIVIIEVVERYFRSLADKLFE